MIAMESKLVCRPSTFPGSMVYWSSKVSMPAPVNAPPRFAEWTLAWGEVEVASLCLGLPELHHNHCLDMDGGACILWRSPGREDEV